MTGSSAGGTLLKWAARLTAAASIALLLAFVAGHITDTAPRPTLSEGIGLLCFPVGVLVGLGMAFRFEKAGAVLALGSLAAFYVWHLVESGDLPRGPWFAIFASPALLFLLHGLLFGNSSCAGDSEAGQKAEFPTALTP